MKKITLLSLLFFGTLTAFSQTQLDKSTFKDYKTCQTCFDNWKKDNNDLTQLKSSLNEPLRTTKRQMSDGAKRTLKFLVTSTIAVAGIVAYDKLYNGMANINTNTNFR
jgi:hypothetical protein